MDNPNPSLPVLNVERLTVAYRRGKDEFDAVREASLSIFAGQTMGLVGESGSGKTTLALAIMRYLSPNALVRSGEVQLLGRDILDLSPAEMGQVWGRQVGYVPQNPLSALNPSLTIGEQIAEGLRWHRSAPARQARRQAVELLEMVRISDPAHIANSYPHQISGGMQQRVLIAIALSLQPALLVLDEPTTSLDVTTQAAILELVKELIRTTNTAVLYVTHDLGVVAQICDRVAVLYAGELVEEGLTPQVFADPRHPYTRGLLDSVPRLGVTKEKQALRSIQGQIPPLGRRPEGCVFRPRCPLAIEICLERPPLYPAGDARLSRCHRWEEMAAGQVDAGQPLPGEIAASQPQLAGGRPVTLQVEDLRVHFVLRRSLAVTLGLRPEHVVRAVNGVSLEIESGRTLGLVGESGSGKTTLARAVMGLVPPTGGEIKLLEARLRPKLGGRGLDVLRHLQMVFQNPEEAFNPYQTIGVTLRRPLVTLAGLSPSQADARAAELLQAVRLPADYTRRYPSQLSGGEKQRVAVARAFASNPELVVCDEPVSSLDVSVQTAILNLLNSLQAENAVSLLFISHNLAVVGYLADVIAVIYLGHLMEVSAGGALFEPPYHPYTEALLAAVPDPDPAAQAPEVILTGDQPSPTQIPQGCPFHTRCPRFLGDVCVEVTPPWQVDAGSGKRYFCHIPPQDLLAIQERLVDPGPGTEEG